MLMGPDMGVLKNPEEKKRKKELFSRNKQKGVEMGEWKRRAKGVVLAQYGRAAHCGCEGHGFKSHLLPECQQ